MQAKVELEPGPKLGQFEVLVDGKVVASRKSGLLAMVRPRPWPDPAEVSAAVLAATQETAS